MRNSTVLKPKGIVKSTQRAVINMGMKDYLEGKGFRPEYEFWDKATQGRYENGRLIGANFKLSGHKVKPIHIPDGVDLDTRLPTPFSPQAYWASNAKVGHWRPEVQRTY